MDSKDQLAVKYLRAKKLVDDYVANHSPQISCELWPMLREKARGAGKGPEFIGFMDDVIDIAREKFC